MEVVVSIEAMKKARLVLYTAIVEAKLKEKNA